MLQSLLTLAPPPSGLSALEHAQRLATEFKRIANHLLRSYSLVINKIPFQIIDVEIYFYDSEFHPDVYSHRQQIQLEKGLMYFHKSGSGYRGGSRKGLDLTFGQNGAFGGILIRCIKHKELVIEGPSLVVDYILSTFKSESISKFIKSCLNGNLSFCEENIVWISPVSLYPVASVLECYRVGLTPKLETNALKFLAKRYRFVSIPGLLKKGRHQIIEGTIHAQRNQKPLLADEQLVENVSKICGVPTSSVKRDMADLRRGEEKSRGGVEGMKTGGTRDMVELYGALSKLYPMNE